MSLGSMTADEPVAIRMKITLYLLSIFFFLFIGCSKRAVVRFDQRPPDLTSADILTEIMLVNKSPRIVLRVPDTRKGVTNTQATTDPQLAVVKPVRNNRSIARFQTDESKYDETALYNAIEKQLFKEGFSVRDRGLFNQVLDANQSIAYSKISSLTDTDLILELVRIDNPVGYTTNICYVEPGNQQRLINEYRDMNGASVEFKLVHVKSNEIVGSYKIHYTPCLDGCRGIYKKAGSRGIFTRDAQKLTNRAYQMLDQDALELFITDATHQFVKTMR